MCDGRSSEEGGVLDSVYYVKVGESSEDKAGHDSFYGEFGRPVGERSY
jgi:hypothetical protein